MRTSRKADEEEKEKRWWEWMADLDKRLGRRRAGQEDQGDGQEAGQEDGPDGQDGGLDGQEQTLICYSII